METQNNLNKQKSKRVNSTPFFATTKSFVETIEELLRKGEKIEFVSFSEWQKKHNLNIKVNQKEYKPLGY